MKQLLRKTAVRHNLGKTKLALHVVLALSACCSLQSCGVFTAENHSRNERWEDYTARGYAAERAGNWKEAEKLYQQALDVSAKFQKTDLRRTMTLIDFAAMLQKQGDDKRAFPLYQEAIAGYEKWRENRKGDEETNRIGKRMASCYRGIANIYVARNLEKEAIANFEKAEAFAVERYIPKRFVLELYREKIVAFKKFGRTSEANALATKMQGVSDGLEATLFGKSLVDLDWQKARDRAAGYEAGGDYIAAAAERGREAEVCRTKYGAADSRTMQLLNEQARALRSAKKLKDAEALLQRAIKDHGERADPLLGDVYTQLASIRFETGRYDDAIKSADRSAAIGRELDEDLLESGAYWIMAMSHNRIPGHRTQAISMYEKAMKAREGTLDSDYYGMLLSLSELYAADKRFADAAHLLEQGATSQKKFPPTPLYERTLRTLAQVYAMQGETAKAKQANADADRLKNSLNG